MWPPESLKSRKTVFTDNHSHKLLEQCETQTSFRNFYLRKNVLISSGKSNDVKIRIWSKGLGTRLLRATGFIEIPWRPKILSPKSYVCSINLWDKSLGTSTSYSEHFRFTCGDKTPSKFVQRTKYYDYDCLRKQFFAISALAALSGAKWFHVEPRKTTFLFFISVPGLNYHFL